MDKTSIIGIIIGFAAIGLGMFLKGITVESLLNPAAFLIIIFGTIASVLIAFPSRVIKNVPYLFKIIFTEKDQVDVKELIDQFTEWAEQTRREGLLSLEGQMAEVDDPFLNSGLQMAVDGQNPDFIRDVLMEKVAAMESRHEEGAKVFSQAGTYAPTLGVLGAVVGLIAALGSMDNMEVLGAAISAAFIATLLGIFTGYVLWHPFANKLKEKSKQEVKMKEIMVEGILSITAGESPAVIKDKLSSYLSSKDIEKMERKSEEQEGGNVAEETK
ncbi:flagellar motor stator protein MotA [Pseudogracilibacillus auburnensis]|uniref:Chemotaxis protein MotA n=1 Tax=Pseudogracilibacillus auburnensis TaxID=1494959 RepID=A0A2V3W1A1_9BACI|nr:flagellar motor stator protein MotA [Pseudogracilibacillus auburnensis]MBO1002216.1 flagellar motor stator protein MotA [Pseudogracilibacillus auburnensis]PXW87546.1 chemotaxis protein MotA [Pseudogracilibacillus auburnensis]